MKTEQDLRYILLGCEAGVELASVQNRETAKVRLWNYATFMRWFLEENEDGDSQQVIMLLEMLLQGGREEAIRRSANNN